jgi:hypothetical protein
MPYQDGNFPSGAGTLNINGVIYKCNSFNQDKSDTVTDINDENGKHSGALAFDGKTGFTAEMQLPNAATDGLVTTSAENSNTGTFSRDNSNFFISGVSRPKAAQGAWVVNLTGQKKVN